jgi:hypothetical protein
VFRSIVENEEGAPTVNAGVDAFVSPTPEIQALSALQSETPTPWGNVRHDAYTFRFAMDYLTRVHPRVLYVALDETWLAIASPDSPRHGERHDHPPLFQNQIAATIAAALGLEYREQNPEAGAPIEAMRVELRCCDRAAASHRRRG